MRAGFLVGWMIGILLVLETAVQVRSHLRTGQSILNANAEESLYVRDTARNLTLLRPNRTFRGSQATIQTNSLGLRGGDISPAPKPGSLRVAIVGASTIMDPFAATNADTIPALVDRELTQSHGRAAEVINAGIAGATLASQARMIRAVVAPLEPSVVVVYPGANDFSRYCRGGDGADNPAPPSLESRIARQVLIFDLLLKNTTRLRDNPARLSARHSPVIDLTRYRNDTVDLIQAARKSNLPLVLSTNARAYTRDLPPQQQELLSADARYLMPCFSLAELHDLYEQHNLVLVDTAAKYEVPVIRADQLVPGGRAHFIDSVHLNDAGRRLLAAEIARMVVSTTAQGPKRGSGTR